MKKVLGLSVLMVAVMSVSAFAGVGGTEFQSIYDLILGWAQGYLGKTLALVMFLTGIGMGVARQSIWAAVIGVSAAIAVYYAPNIIDSIVAATI